MNVRVAGLVLAGLLVAVSGCAAGPPRATALGDAELNHGYALLWATVTDLTRVEQVLWVKRPSDEVAVLLRAISAFAREAQGELEALARADARLGYDADGLPQVETAAREALERSSRRRILGSSGKAFELQILLTQRQALDYVSHVARVLGEREADETRRAYLAELEDRSGALYGRVVGHLERGYGGSGSD